MLLFWYNLFIEQQEMREKPDCSAFDKDKTYNFCDSFEETSHEINNTLYIFAQNVCDCQTWLDCESLNIVDNCQDDLYFNPCSQRCVK